MKENKYISYGFIDAANLFYGGEKSLGWKIDYQKLFNYLGEKYAVGRILYFGGIETYKFKFDYLKNETVPIGNLKKYLKETIENCGENDGALLRRHLQKIKFYSKLESFGYEMFLKPVKLYCNESGTIKKANCDVDMTFQLMKEKDNFTRAVILSGDGDFLPVLKYLKDEKKEIVILSRGQRTAREIRRFAGGNFKDFSRLEKTLRFGNR